MCLFEEVPRVSWCIETKLTSMPSVMACKPLLGATNLLLVGAASHSKHANATCTKALCMLLRLNFVCLKVCLPWTP